MTDRGPDTLAPRDAMQRWLNHCQTEYTDETVESYYYRLKLFVEWCEGQGIEQVSDLTGWDLDTYENGRQGAGVAASTLNNEMQTLKVWMEYLARIEAVDADVPEKVHIPEVSDHEATDETMLEPADARALIQWFRDTPAVYATRRHALLELLWYTGARSGAIAALDVRDYHSDDHYVEFHHRPKTDTGLKKGTSGERPVGFPERVSDVLDDYLAHTRIDTHDDHGRQPLLTSQRGRPGGNTIRVWSYMATLPCQHTECPHGKNPETCEYKHYHHASGCPSSRSPHQVRTGSIIWQRNLGFPPEVVAERVNSSVEAIEKYYDHATALERMHRRRRPYIDKMEL